MTRCLCDVSIMSKPSVLQLIFDAFQMGFFHQRVTENSSDICLYGRMWFI